MEKLKKSSWHSMLLVKDLRNMLLCVLWFVLTYKFVSFFLVMQQIKCSGCSSSLQKCEPLPGQRWVLSRNAPLWYHSFFKSFFCRIRPSKQSSKFYDLKVLLSLLVQLLNWSVGIVSCHSSTVIYFSTLIMFLGSIKLFIDSAESSIVPFLQKISGKVNELACGARILMFHDFPLLKLEKFELLYSFPFTQGLLKDYSF